LAGDHVKRYVAWGAGPRASQTMTSAARALALLRGRSAASVEEVRAVMKPVLRHRVIPNYNATGEGVTVDQIIEKLAAAL
jgi:MoxR-like ATPase